MFILIRLTQHVSSIIMLIIRRTYYIKKTACGECLVVLAAVVQSWDTSCVHCLKVGIPTFTNSRLPRDPISQRWNYVGEKWPMNFA